MGEGSHEGLGWLTLLIQNVPDHRTGVSKMEILRDFCAEPNGMSVIASSQLAQIVSVYCVSTVGRGSQSQGGFDCIKASGGQRVEVEE